MVRTAHVHLGYTPANAVQHGSFRQVKVQLVGPGRNHTVRTRTGYYARGVSATAKVSGSTQ